jgi:hypothetical protein
MREGGAERYRMRRGCQIAELIGAQRFPLDTPQTPAQQGAILGFGKQRQAAVQQIGHAASL